MTMVNCGGAMIWDEGTEFMECSGGRNSTRGGDHVAEVVHNLLAMLELRLDLQLWRSGSDVARPMRGTGA